jgi:hypothetical protein
MSAASDDLEAARDAYHGALVTVWSYADDCAAAPSMLNRGKLQAASRACQAMRLAFLAASSRLADELEDTRLPLQPITTRAKAIEVPQ